MPAHLRVVARNGDPVPPPDVRSVVLEVDLTRVRRAFDRASEHDLADLGAELATALLGRTHEALQFRTFGIRLVGSTPAPRTTGA